MNFKIESGSSHSELDCNNITEVAEKMIATGMKDRFVKVASQSQKMLTLI